MSFSSSERINHEQELQAQTAVSTQGGFWFKGEICIGKNKHQESRFLDTADFSACLLSGFCLFMFACGIASFPFYTVGKTV